LIHFYKRFQIDVGLECRPDEYSSMGQKVSRVYGSLVKRPLQRYNVEHRAAKVISKIEDPAAPASRAPMYDSDKELLDKIRRTNPQLAEANFRKDSDLHSRLTEVYVTSQDPENQPKPAENPDRPLPADRSQYSEDFIPGMMRVDRSKSAPRGKVSLENAIQFLTDHSTKPEIHTAQHISDTFRINPETTANALKYFRVFKVYVPEKKFDKEYDALALGKDWVDGKKEEYQSMLQYNQEREDKLKRMKEKEARKKDGLLEEGKKAS